MNVKSLRDEMKTLIQESDSINKRAESEARELSAVEFKDVTEMLDRVEEIKSLLEQEKRRQRLADYASNPTSDPEKPELDKGSITSSRKSFSGIGEMAIAVYRASVPGGSIDPRLVRAASGMNESVPSQGGFLVDKESNNELLKRTYDTGVVARLCSRRPIGPGKNGVKMNAIDETSRADGSRSGGVRAYWTDEAGDKTGTKPKLRKVELSLEKLTALCYATDELLDDAVALEGLLMDEYPSEMGFKLDDAIINGTGAGQPLGIMNSPCLVTVPAEGGQPASTIYYENIVNMWARLWPRSQKNAVWLINNDIIPELFTMSLAVGTGGGPVYLPAGGASAAPYATIYNRPVIPIEQCQTLGTTGDIILADFSEYLLIDKGGVSSAMSIHNKFESDQTTFRWVYRVNGQPKWHNTLTPYKGTNTLSPFVALETRS